jgi:hypothetical protein
MIFGMFAKAKQPPLTAFCTKLSVRKNLIRVAGIEATKASLRTDKRAVVLSLIYSPLSTNSYPHFLSNSGSLAMFAAILLASSFVSNFAADRRPGSSSK